MLDGVPPAGGGPPRIRFFNLGGGPTIVGGGVGFTEGGLVHAVRSFAPLAGVYDVTVVCPNVPDAGEEIRDVTIDGVRVTCPRPPLAVRWMCAGEMSAEERPLRTVLNWPSILAGYISQSRQLARSGVDVVISNGIVASYLAGRMRGPWATVAVIHHLYHDPWTTGAASTPRGALARMERFLLRRLRADAVAVVNPSVATCLKRFGFPEERVCFVGNGVDPSQFAFTAHHDADSLVFVGRLRNSKGVESVLDAFAIVRRQRPRAMLHIAGDGLLRQALQSRAAALGLGGGVVFHGFVDEGTKVHLLRSSGIYVSASRFEGFDIPVVEAMATGAVPVVSDIPAHRFIFQGRDVGFLRESPEDMAAAVLRLMEQPDLRQSMAVAGRALVEEMWTWDRVAQRYRALVDGLLASRTGRKDGTCRR